MRLTVWAATVTMIATTLGVGGSTASANVLPRAASTIPQVVVTAESHHDTSAPLRTISPSNTPSRAHPALHILPPSAPGLSAPNTSGPQVRSSPRIPTTSTNFDGIGANGSAPPDNDGAAGPTQYVELVNSRLAVYSKTGAPLLGPEATNTLWSGFGGGCQANNDGDGTVLFDTLSQRWVVQQFSVTTTPYLECVAVSTSNDATGSWNRYSFQPSTNFPDYPKLGVWADGYYVSYNLFNAAGTQGLGTLMCAYNRDAMIAGTTSTQQCFLGTTQPEKTALPATVDGTRPPPAGAPEWFVGLSPTTANAVAYYKYHVDWTAPANSTLTGPTDVPVQAFSPACGGAAACVPQPGTTQQLDSLGDRLMYRLAYRNFGDHEAMVVTHSITAGSSVGARWYELRPSSGALTVFQQGTYAPDATYRWMGSVAMDSAGDMGLGYSASSTSLHPGIRYTGRLAADPAGQMPQGESTIITGPGSQTGSNLSRWGDYTEMTVDPADDCTFWYVNEYEPADGSFNWATRIASFKFPGCGGTPINDFSIAANPSSLSVVQGSSVASTISTAVTSGAAQTVSLSTAGLPSGATASFNPGSITAGGSSTLTINTSTSASVGTYTLTVTGTGASATHTTSVALTVTQASGGGGVVNGGFEAGLTGWTSTGTTAVVNGGAQAGAYAARVGGTGPTNGDSSVAQTFTVPSNGTGVSFWYNVTCPDSVTYDWATATLKDNTTGTTTTLLAKTCVNPNSGWKQVTAPAQAGHSVTLTLTSHDDNYAGDPTYTLYDSVSVTTGGGGGGGGITNGGFETGTFSGWTTSGAATAVVTTTPHSGTYDGRGGATTPTNGDSNIVQTFTVPSGATSLSFWYKMTCPDTVTYDWATATLKNNGTGTTTTPLAKTCTTNSWTQVTASVAGGTSYTLTLTSHDDNYSSDPSFTLFDDITVS